MNISFKLMELRPLLGNIPPYAQIYQQLSPLAERAGLLTPPREEGAGYLQWSLPGDDWTSLADAEPGQKAEVGAVYNERYAALAETLKTVAVRDALLSVPSEREILFRPNGSSWDIAMVAWGYKYPNVPPMGKITGVIAPRKDRQQVNIGFVWDEQMLPNFDFLLDNLKRHTGDDGFFRFDAPVEVGSTYDIVYNGDALWQLSVEKGREDYVHDLTQHIQIVVSVTVDGQPVSGESCFVGFNGKQQTVTTDENGKASVCLSLLGDSQGQPLTEQPPCQVTCRDAVQTQTPSLGNDTLTFEFDFTTKKPYVAPEVEEKKEEQTETPLVEMVHLRLLDYGGYPMPDLEFTLHTKKKGDVVVKTDGDGHYAVPKDWLEPNEKVKLRLSISDAYQKEHDLHDTKKRKKKEKKS